MPKKFNVDDLVDSISDINSTENVARKVNNSENNSVTYVTINKPEKKEAYKRITYHLKTSTIRSINRLANQADMGISEFVQKLFDEILEKIEIR
jgi:hypothetical protein